MGRSSSFAARRAEGIFLRSTLQFHSLEPDPCARGNRSSRNETRGSQTSNAVFRAEPSRIAGTGRSQTQVAPEEICFRGAYAGADANGRSACC
jgi:hypothetical protein